MKEKCPCCGLDIYYEDKRGKPGNVVVLPADSLKSAYVQKAVHQGNSAILPLVCRGECAGKCAAAAIIAGFQPNKK